MRAEKAGATAEAARAYSDSIYPPDAADYGYERKLSEIGPELPWGSALGLLLTILSVFSVINSAVAETGARPPATMIIGFGLAQLGWVIFAFGVIVGRFRIFDLEGRWKTIVFSVLFFTVGTLLINTQIFWTLF